MSVATVNYSAVKSLSLRPNTALLTIFVNPFFPAKPIRGGSRYSLVTRPRWPKPLHVDSRTPVKLLCMRLARLTALRDNIKQILNIEETIIKY